MTSFVKKIYIYYIGSRLLQARDSIFYSLHNKSTVFEIYTFWDVVSESLLLLFFCSISVEKPAIVIVGMCHYTSGSYIYIYIYMEKELLQAGVVCSRRNGTVSPTAGDLKK